MKYIAYTTVFLILLCSCGGGSNPSTLAGQNTNDIEPNTNNSSNGSNLDPNGNPGDPNVRRLVHGDPVFYGPAEFGIILQRADPEDYHQHELNLRTVHPYKSFDDAVAMQSQFTSEFELTMNGIYSQMENRYADYIQGLVSDDQVRFDSDKDFFLTYVPNSDPELIRGEFIYDVPGGGELLIRLSSRTIIFGGKTAYVSHFGINWTINRDGQGLSYSKMGAGSESASLGADSNATLPYNTEYALYLAGTVNVRQIRTGIIE